MLSMVYFHAYTEHLIFRICLTTYTRLASENFESNKIKYYKLFFIIMIPLTSILMVHSDRPEIIRIIINKFPCAIYFVYIYCYCQFCIERKNKSEAKYIYF